MELKIISNHQFQELVDKIAELQRTFKTRASESLVETWLNTKQAAQALQITTRTLQSYRDQGMIPFSQFGREIRYRQSDIQEFLLEHYIKGRRAG